MTKEQAIKILKADETDDSFDWGELGLKGTEDFNRAWDEAYDMAIRALEQKPCNDTISREVTINKINELIAEYIPIMPVGWTLPLNIARTIIDLPSVTPQPKIGYWKWQLASNGWADHICSECGFKHNTDIHVTLNWKYCPNCGMKMEVNADVI